MMMPKALCFSLLAVVILFFAGCSSEPAAPTSGPVEITIKIDGLDAMTQALQNIALVEMKPSEIQLGDKTVLYVPSGTTTNGYASVKYTFFELVDGELKQIDFAAPTSNR